MRPFLFASIRRSLLLVVLLAVLPVLAIVLYTGRELCANVDLFSGLIYNMLGISEDLYTPLFAIARVPGWCAHRVEEVVFANRIIRPAYKYLGVRQKYKPIEER